MPENKKPKLASSSVAEDFVPDTAASDTNSILSDSTAFDISKILESRPELTNDPIFKEYSKKLAALEKERSAIASEALSLSRKSQFSEEDNQRIKELKDRSPSLAKELVACLSILAASEAGILESVHDVEVIYGQSFEKYIEDYKKADSSSLSYVGLDITAEHFLLQKIEKTEKPKIVIFHFNKKITSEEVIKEIGRFGFRPARTEEFIELLIQHPNLQKEYWLVALLEDDAHRWRGSDGYLRVLSARLSGEGRDLDYFRFGRDWDPIHRFVAVCK